MKFYRANTTKDLNSLEQGKVKLSVNGDDIENIWVAKDPENKKMYLLNNAVAFYPIPSWGSEWDLASSIDVAEARGESFDDTVLTFHPSQFDNLKEFMLDDNEFDVDRFLSQEYTDSSEESEENKSE